LPNKSTYERPSNDLEEIFLPECHVFRWLEFSLRQKSLLIFHATQTEQRMAATFYAWDLCFG